MNSNQTEKRAFLILLLIFLMVGIYLLRPFLSPIILGAIITILFYPIHTKYLVWTKKKENLAAGLSVISVILIVIIPVVIVLFLVTTQIANLVNPETGFGTSIPDSVQHLKDLLVQWTGRFDSLLGLGFNLTPIVTEKLKRLAEMMAQYSPLVVTETLNFSLQIFIMLVISFYLFKNGKDFLKLAIRLTPVKDQYERVLAAEVKEMVQGVFYGNFLTALVQSVLATVGFFIVGVEAYIVWGVMTFFMSFLPMLGTAVVIVPITLIVFLQGHLGKAIFLLIYGTLFVGAADNVLRPFLIRSNMHPLVLFLSIFGGLAVFGMIGIVVGPVLMAILTVILRIYARDFT